MRVYISVDMEGIAGIATLDQTVRGGHGYPLGQSLMTGETNAAIEGAFAGGATEVLVNDSHGTMDNLVHSDIDRRARLVFGKPKKLAMSEGLNASYDVAMYIGYHGPAGGSGVLAHTVSSTFGEVRLNGNPISETDLNAIYAGSLGVPLGLVTGDDAICNLVTKNYPGVIAIAVKEARGWSAADSVAPEVACDLIREGAMNATGQAAQLPAILVPEALELEVDLPNTTAAELAAYVPKAQRVGNLTVRLVIADPVELLGVMVLWSQLADAGLKQRAVQLDRR